jgi:hypothetical protein
MRAADASASRLMDTAISDRRVVSLMSNVCWRSVATYRATIRLC